VTDFDAMARKTYLKQALKWVPLSTEAEHAIALDTMAEAGIEQPVELPAEVAQTLDADFAVEEDGEQEEKPTGLDAVTAKLQGRHTPGSGPKAAGPAPEAEVASNKAKNRVLDEAESERLRLPDKRGNWGRQVAALVRQHSPEVLRPILVAALDDLEAESLTSVPAQHRQVIFEMVSRRLVEADAEVET